MPETTPHPAGLSATHTKPRQVLTVSEITQDIKLILENAFGEVWVVGEVSGVRRIHTGTIFFNLKDDNSILKCVIFFSDVDKLKFELKDGMQAVCFGRISVYDKRGDYQLYAQIIEPKGIGSLQMALEQLKQKLEKEGLFSAKHKKPIPYLPSRIGVVTSISGAAIKDIFKVLDRRFADVHIIVISVLVQGDGAKEEIARAIKDFNLFNETLPAREHIEVMIVGRGGGSIEDLWAFNEEVVARAIYHSQIPVISAVGHERDWTVADLVADVRAPTPSAAAEMVMPKKEDLKEKLHGLLNDLNRIPQDLIFNLRQNLDDCAYRMNLSMYNLLKLEAAEFQTLHKKLLLLNPVVLIKQHKEKIKDLTQQISLRIQHFIRLRMSEFRVAAEKLSSLSPLNILGRGYSITFSVPDGNIIKDASGLKEGDSIRTKLHKGKVLSKIVGVERNVSDAP